MDSRAQNLYEMTKHRDLSVTSTTSLEVGKNFDPKAWIAKRHDLERQLRVAKIEYALALKVDADEFPANEDDVESIDVTAELEEDNKID